MIKSMTGFGRCEIQQDSKKFTVELKSVNHRYLDVNIRMPKKLNFFETSIRTLLKSYANRGKVDIFITYEDLSLARFPEVLTMEEQVEDEEELWNGLKKALEGAFTQFVETRITEGENLKKDILAKLTFLEQEVAAVEERSPQIVAEYRQKLEEKVAELLADTQMEENRLAAEVILYADKICTDEEVVRLKSHIQHMRATLEEKEGIGRKLDFIAQEMNREANTILSKANDIEVSNHAISLKTEIEKIREQIQNIE